MRRPRYLDFECPTCGSRCERFVETNDDGTPCEPQFCDEQLWSDDMPPAALGHCGGKLSVVEFANAPLMAPLAGKDIKTNLDDASRQQARLEKRQDEHWRRQGRDEAIERERAMLKKNGMEGAGGVK